jgi:hypothetical protein
MGENTREKLAEGQFCTVEACNCGVLHVSIGPFSIRLEAAVVESIWVTLGEAIRRLATRPAGAAQHTCGAAGSTDRRRSVS